MILEDLLSHLQDKGSRLDIKTKSVTLQAVQVECFKVSDDRKSIYIRFNEGHELKADVSDFLAIERSAPHWGITYFHNQRK